MLEKNYKNEMNRISPDENAKRRTLFAISTERQKKRGRAARLTPKICFAVTACAAIVLSVIFIPRNVPMLTDTTDEGGKYYKSAEDYGTIYRKLSTILSEVEREKGSDSYVINESAVSVGTTATTKDLADASDTNVQVENVDEADIIKNDGKYIYYLNSAESRLEIALAEGDSAEAVSSTRLDDGCYYDSIYLYGDKLVVIGRKNAESGVARGELIDSLYSAGGGTVAVFIDITDRAKPKIKEQFTQSGSYHTSRMVDGKLYLITNHYVYGEIEEDKPETYIPNVVCPNGLNIAAPESILIKNGEVGSPEYLVLGGYDLDGGGLVSTCSVLGNADTVYCSSENLITADLRFREAEGEQRSTNYTVISRFEIKDGKITYKATGEADGELLNQFSIDEHNGYFRFVLTESYRIELKDEENAESSRSVWTAEILQKNSLRILDGNLKQVGAIVDLAPDERIYSARFMGDTAYFVTFRQTDPLFAADLSDPASPRILSQLKIPGFSNYLFPYGEGRLFGIGRDADEESGGAEDIKLSMFDTSDPANVTEEAKTIVEGYTWSSALYDHHALLISEKKGLIGFTVEKYDNKAENKSLYLIYRYNGTAFERAAELELGLNGSFYTHTVRGMFIGDRLYTVSNSGIIVYSLDNFGVISSMEF